MIKKRVERTGDGTHRLASENDENNNVAEKVDHSDLWGWGNIELNSPSQNIFLIFRFFSFSTDDKEMTDEDRKYVKILYKCYD